MPDLEASASPLAVAAVVLDGGGGDSSWQWWREEGGRREEGGGGGEWREEGERGGEIEGYFGGAVDLIRWRCSLPTVRKPDFRSQTFQWAASEKEHIFAGGRLNSATSEDPFFLVVHSPPLPPTPRSIFAGGDHIWPPEKKS